MGQRVKDREVHRQSRQHTKVGEFVTEGKSRVSGVIVEVRPKALFRVRLENGQVVLAGASSKLRHAIVRLLVGDAVTVELTRHDPNRGQIVDKV